MFVCLYNFIFICISFIENYFLSLFELGMCVCVAAWTLNFLSCIGASPFGSTLPNAGLKQTHTNRVANTKHSEAVAPSHPISYTDTYSIYLVYANGSCVCVKCISFCQSECIFLSTLTFPALRPCFPFFCSPSSIPHSLPLLHQLSLHSPWTLFGCSCHHSGSVLWRRLPPCCSSSVLRCCHFPFNEHFPFGFSPLTRFCLFPTPSISLLLDKSQKLWLLQIFSEWQNHGFVYISCWGKHPKGTQSCWWSLYTDCHKET